MFDPLMDWGTPWLSRSFSPETHPAFLRKILKDEKNSLRIWLDSVGQCREIVFNQNKTLTHDPRFLAGLRIIYLRTAGWPKEQLSLLSELVPGTKALNL